MHFSIGLFLGLVLISGSTAKADILYTVTDLGTFPAGTGLLGRALNDAGQVTGFGDVGLFNRFAFLYSNGRLTTVEALAAGDGINNAGQITGSAGGHAVIYSEGHVIDLGAGSGSTGWAINDAGQVAGSFDTSSGIQRAFLYMDGEIRDLGTLAGYNSSVGLAINSVGEVTGWSYIYTSSGFSQHAFLYRDGKMTDLGSLGSGISAGYGINNAGQVTGWSSTFTSPYTPHAFLYTDGQMRDLGALTASGYSQGLGINNAGQVVGYSSGQGTHAFLYRDGQMLDLNDLIDPALHITLAEAIAINDQGQILANTQLSYGEGGTPAPHAYLLTPVPEPSTWVLFGVALLGLAFKTGHSWLLRQSSWLRYEFGVRALSSRRS